MRSSLLAELDGGSTSEILKPPKDRDYGIDADVGAVNGLNLDGAINRLDLDQATDFLRDGRTTSTNCPCPYDTDGDTE